MSGKTNARATGRITRAEGLPSKVTLLGLLAAITLSLAGCKGVPTTEERQARRELKQVGTVLRAANPNIKLPPLKADAGLSNFLAYAILNHPRVSAAYYDWAASVERITVERSLPDPRLTFESDIGDMLMTLMPGLMMDFPGPGKLSARARAASAESQSKYFAFESSVLQAAADLKKAYYQLYFLETKLEVNRATLNLVRELEQLARTQVEVGKATLQDALRAQIEQERLNTEITNLEDSREPLLTQFRSALGLPGEHSEVPIPRSFETTPIQPATEQQLLAQALDRNPKLRAMQADVRRAEALISLAAKARLPDFSLGLEADVKASPWVYRPQFSVTLPIWRDKIAAQIAEAHAARNAAESRLLAERLSLAVMFAEKSFTARESARNIQLLTERLLPKAAQSLEVGRTGYGSGKTDFINLIDAERTLLEFRLLEVEARTQREMALTELSLLILANPPEQAPLLTAPSASGIAKPQKEPRP